MRIVILVAAVVMLGILTHGVPSAEGDRTVGDYRFIPTPQVRDPFITTHFSSLTGASIATGADMPPFVIPTSPPDTIAGQAGDFAFILVQAEYQYAFGNNTTLRGSYTGGSRIGTTSSSILAQGVTATFEIGLGTTVALWRHEHFLLSALADIGQSKALVIDPIAYVQDIIDENPNAPGLLYQEDRTIFSPGLSIAWAFSSWSGLLAEGRVGQSNGSVTKSNTVWKASGAVSFDFGQRGHTPIGLLASVEVNSTPSLIGGESEVTTSVGVDVVYTGREDLTVGVELVWSDLPLEFADATANPISAALVFRYFF